MGSRRIKINYRKVDTDALVYWLEKNDIKYAFVPYEPEVQPRGKETIGTLVYYLEVYDCRHELAVRIKWDVE